MNQIIQFKRNQATTFATREAALTYLNTTATYNPGEPILAIYGANKEALLAIGTGTGTGINNFTLIPDGFEVDMINSEITLINDALDTKVDKEAGKGLSTNDFTDTSKTKVDNLGIYLTGLDTPSYTGVNATLGATFTNPTIGEGGGVSVELKGVTTTKAGLMLATDKVKLDGITTGAEVNQNAYSNVKVGTTTIAATSKTDTVEFVAGSNITLTPDAAGKKVTVAASGTTSLNLTSAADQPVVVGGTTGAVTTTIKDSVELPGNPTVAGTLATTDDSANVATTAFVQDVVTLKIDEIDAIEDAAFNTDTHVMTFTFRDGTTKAFNLLLDSFLVDAGFVKDQAAWDANWKATYGDQTITEPSLFFVVKENRGGVETNVVILVPAGELVDEYTAGAGLTLSGTNEFSVATGGITEAMLVTALQTKINGKADKTITVTGTNGLTGGGALSANRTISHATKTPTITGTGYVSDITFDAYGHPDIVTKTEVITPGESGRVSVTDSDTTIDHLANKLLPKANVTGNEYAVESVTVAKAGNVQTMQLFVTIDTIDGGTY